MSTGLVSVSDCYHCGLPVPEHLDFRVEIEGQQRVMCCPGCQAVAASIVAGGLENFYRFRSEPATRPSEDTASQWAAYDLPEVQQDFVRELEGFEKEAQILIDGITCAACVWLIEKQLSRLPGVKSVSVNASTHRCLLHWDGEQQPLSQILANIKAIGYEPRPATDEQLFNLRKQESRTALMRLGVAGFGMMQVGMVAVALYAGGMQGISESMESLLRYLSLLIATPVVFYSAQPFFFAAWRSLKLRSFQHLSMDVPVSLAIGGAYLASIYATLSKSGEVYYDSVSMFTFFLLLGRFFEMRVRHGNSLASGNLAQLLPLTVNRLVDEEEHEVIPLKSLQVGDRVLVREGEIIPCDGLVVRGHSKVEEALLTGEAQPCDKSEGDFVIAGTLNSVSALQLEVKSLGEGTVLSAIDRMVQKAQAEKPRQQAFADRLASYFVSAVLLVTSLVGLYWYFEQPSQAIWIVLSVLVVTCPCALSLATPLALAAGTAAARRQGFLISRAHVLESMAKITHAVFDKTGTLTEGHLKISKVCTPLAACSLEEGQEQAYRLLAAALEKQNVHPIAKAFTSDQSLPVLDAVHNFVAEGVEGAQAGRTYRLGSEQFIREGFADARERVIVRPAANDPSLQWVLLASDQEPLLWFGLSDAHRSGAKSLMESLRREGVATELLSGDSSAAVETLAIHLSMSRFQAGAKPDEKLARVQTLQREGACVLMLGDGINDVPVLAAADVSVAMGAASDLAQVNADAVLLHNDLSALGGVRKIAQHTQRVIRQNISWALLYNVLALPLAVMGFVPPWAAAIGMSLSSLLVTANSMRLNRQSTAGET